VAELNEHKAVFTGTGLSRVGRKTGIPDLELTAEAARAAIADAGLEVQDIDGIASLGETPIRQVATELGLAPQWAHAAGAVGGLYSPVFAAVDAIAAGRARHVLIYRTVMMMGGATMPDQIGAEAPEEVVEDGDFEIEESGTMGEGMGDVGHMLAYHAYGAPHWLGMHARRHMHLYGTTKEQLGWLAVNCRRNAALNPKAAMRDPITLDDYLAARPVAEPFGLLDCDIPVDGSVAFVLSAADYGKDAPKPAIRINAMAGAPGAPGAWWYRDDYPHMASWDAARNLWARTELTAADLDFGNLYSGFTFLTFAWLEALGICEEGGAGPFVEGASRIALDGSFPLNTYGGQLSAGRLHGYGDLLETITQLRGEAGERQVAKDVEVGVSANGGGPIAGAMILTR
jgi:acetyl-CoA acetyltransferase